MGQVYCCIIYGYNMPICPLSIPSPSLMKYFTLLMRTPSHQCPTHTNEDNRPGQQPYRSTITHMVRRAKL